MPSLGADMESGTLVAVAEEAGRRACSRGDVLAVVETSKGLIDVEVFDDGVLEKLVVQPGATVPVGAVLARIASESARGRVRALLRPAAPPCRNARARSAAPSARSRVD